jgi:hypothetical protein
MLTVLVGDSVLETHAGRQPTYVCPNVLLQLQNKVGREGLHLDSVVVRAHEAVWVETVDPADVYVLRFRLANEGVDLLLPLLFLCYVEILSSSGGAPKWHSSVLASLMTATNI